LLSARASEQHFEPGQVMIHQGARAEELYIIVSGRARVVERPEDPAHTELVLGELGPGDVVGELAILTGMPRSATVVANDRVRCLVIPGPEFVRLLHSAPELSGSLALVLARRIYETDRRLTRFAPDPLTGLLSRRSFIEEYPRIAALARRRQSGVLLLLLDIQNLKAVNDLAGYLVGDEVIRTVAAALLESARRTDVLARWGGDEFAMLPVDAQPAAVGSILGRLEDRLASVGRDLGLPMAIRCAYGVATSNEPPDDVSDLVREADEDMQRRKEASVEAP
jgi:diguanylate cyclase (GGDEF)-like protein